MNVPSAFTLTLPSAGMELVFSALGELPYRVARPVIEAANAQIAEQVSAYQQAMPNEQTTAANAATPANA